MYGSTVQNMEHKEFWRRYREAKEVAFESATSMIVESLPELCMPFINIKWTERLMEEAPFERVYERDKLYRRQGGRGHPHPEQEMVDYFWRDGYVPRWIDLSVYSTKGTITVLQFFASDVFTLYEGGPRTFHVGWPLEPWVAKSPMLPPDWKSAEESGRFSLNWHLHRTRGD